MGRRTRIFESPSENEVILQQFRRSRQVLRTALFPNPPLTNHLQLAPASEIAVIHLRLLFHSCLDLEVAT
jgi:hypothetical protein